MILKRIGQGAWRGRMHPGVRQATGVLAATSAANGLNYLFHVVVSRLLGPSEYGVLVSLLALFLILSLPINLIQTVIANYAAQFRLKGMTGKLKTLFLSSSKKVLIYGGLMTAVFMLLSGMVADFLQVPTVIPVLITGTIVLPSFLLPVATGVLQGSERFSAFSALFLVAGVSRFLFGGVLVFLGLGAAGALAGSALSQTVTLLLAVVLLSQVLRQKGEPHGISSFSAYRYSLRTLLGFLAFTILTNIDVPIVKHFFTPQEAGYYGAASTLGKTVLLASVAVTYVMFPKSVHNHARNGETGPLFRQAVAATALMSGGAALVLFLLPSLAVNILFGSQYEAVIPLVGPFALAMSLYAVLNVVLFYYLSIENTVFVALLLVSAFLEAGLLWAFHAGLVQVVLVLAAVALFSLLVSELVCRGLTGRRRPVPTGGVSLITPTGTG